MMALATLTGSKAWASVREEANLRAKADNLAITLEEHVDIVKGVRYFHTISYLPVFHRDVT